MISITTWIAGLALALVLAPQVAVAQVPVTPVAHGMELDATKVGPAAQRLTPLATHPTVDIKDATALPFKRRIETSATYDGFTVDGPHWLIERVLFTGPVGIMTTLPMVMRGVSIRTRAKAPWGLHTWPDAGPVYFLWSEVAAVSNAGAPADRKFALERALYLRSPNTTVYRSHVFWTSDGIQIHAPRARIVETLIDRLTFWKGDHNDGVQMLGQGAGISILRSRIMNPNNQTSCLNLIGKSVEIESSYLAGGGWTVYAGADNNGHGTGTTSAVVFIDNIFGRDYFPKSGGFGPVAYWDNRAGTGNRWENNRYSTGESITFPRPR